MSRVLLVFADPAIGARLAAEITRAGLETRAVTTGEGAMDHFIQEPSDVVVVDYDLGGRDGVTTAEAIRWMPGGRRARIVLTAAQRPPAGPLEELAQNVGAFATMVGPYEPGTLREAVERAAAVEPHTADTRILTTELEVVEAERRISAAKATGAAPDEPDEKTPVEDLPAERTMVLAMDRSSGDGEPVDRDDGATPDGDEDAWFRRDPDGREEGLQVRALARESETHRDLVGTFDRISFAEILHRLANRRATGALICVTAPDERETTEGKEPTKVVYFRSGVPVHVRSNLVVECLGQVLARMRKIGPLALTESLRVMQRDGARQGEVLVEMGAIEPLELSEALAQQMRLKLYELFAWRRGTFRFTVDHTPPDDLIELELGLADIVFSGLSATQDPAEMVERMEPHRDKFLIPRTRNFVRFLPLSERRSLHTVIRRADGSRTVADVLDAASDRGRAAALLQAMLSLDAVTLEDEPLRTGPREGPELPRLPSVAPPLASPEDEAVDSAIALDSANADPIELEDDTDGNIRPSPVQAKTTRLSSRPPKHAARPSLSHDRSAPAAAAASASDKTTLASARALGIPSEDPSSEELHLISSSEWIKRSGGDDEPSTAADAPAPPNDNTTLAAVARIERSGNDEPPTAAGPPAPPNDKTTLASARALGILNQDPSSDEFEITSSPVTDELTGRSRLSTKPDGALDERVHRLLRAERRFRRGQRALAKSNYTQAITAFEEAVDLCPEEGQFVAHLAWARYLNAPDDAVLLDQCVFDAERGARRTPKLASVHVLHARLLSAAGLVEPARAAYGRALEIEPHHRDAKRELEAL